MSRGLRSCEHCGVLFEQRRRGGKPQRFCTIRCQETARARRQGVRPAEAVGHRSDGTFAIGAPPEQRFLERITIDADGHWLWPNIATDSGYGCGFWLDGQTMRAHRAAHILFIGPIPKGLTVDHVCRVRACCNPEHLEAVTHWENCRRARAAKAERRVA